MLQYAASERVALAGNGLHQRYELIEGQMCSVPFKTALEGKLIADLSAHLSRAANQHKLGSVFMLTGFRLSPTTLLSPAVAFVRNGRITEINDLYIPFAPDLAIEVVSQDDRAAYLQHKVDLYFKAGTPLVWVIYPQLKAVMVFHADRTSETITAGGTLHGETALPDLVLPVADLFPPDPELNTRREYYG